MSNIKIILFGAPWCEPCKNLKSTLLNIMKELTDVEFQNVNIDEEKELTTSYSIISIPTLLFIKDNQEMVRTGGQMSKSYLKSLIITLNK